MKHKLFYYSSLCTIIIAGLLIGYILYLSFIPLSVVKLKQFTVLDDVKAGEYIQYKLEFEKLRNITPKVSYFLVDGIVIELTGGSITRPTGVQSVTSQRYIPIQVPKGTYKMRIELAYPLLPWRTITHVWESNSFEVL